MCYGLDATKIRADNNQCASGGSAWGQEVYERLIAYVTGGGTTTAPTTGDDSGTDDSATTDATDTTGGDRIANS